MTSGVVISRRELDAVGQKRAIVRVTWGIMCSVGYVWVVGLVGG